MGYHCGIGLGMAALGIAPRDPHVTCDGDGCVAVENGLTARADFARQARTIRRLFTAYFLAKGQLKNVNACLAYALERHARLQADVHENVIPESVQAGVDLERARIVTALRDLDLISEYGAVPSLLADAIERGGKVYRVTVRRKAKT